MRDFKFLNFIEFAGRFLSAAVEAWPLWLIAAFLISPIGPHLRWSYVGKDPVYYQCTYLGSRGFVDPGLTPDCPIIVILDARRWKTRP